MPLETFSSINWLAVVVAGLAMFFLGGVWYTALFGKTWQRLHGYSPEKLAEMHARTPPPKFFGMMIACYLVMAFAAAAMTVAVDARGPAAGASLGLVLWLVIAAAFMTNHIASDKHIGIYAIDVGFLLVAMPLGGAILGWWR